MSAARKSPPAATVAPINPMINEGDPLDTLSNVQGAISFLHLTLPGLINNGSSTDATHGLVVILECAKQALDHATLAVQPRMGAQ